MIDYYYVSNLRYVSSQMKVNLTTSEESCVGTVHTLAMPAALPTRRTARTSIQCI